MTADEARLVRDLAEELETALRRIAFRTAEDARRATRWVALPDVVKARRSIRASTRILGELIETQEGRRDRRLPLGHPHRMVGRITPEEIAENVKRMNEALPTFAEAQDCFRRAFHRDRLTEEENPGS